MANELFRTSVMLPNGKRKWIRSKSKEGLEQKKKEVMLQIGTGLDILDNSTFGEYAEVWFNVYKKPYLRRKSLEALGNALNNHIYPFLRDVPLKKVSPMQIQLIVASLAKNSKSLNDKVIQILRGVFNAAVDNNLIAKSPVPTKIKSKGVRTKEKTALTADQSKRLLDAVSSTRAYTFLLIALQTGMRRGEIVGLQWSDIDFERRMICVRHNAVLGRYETTVSELLKTKAGRRDIPMSNEVEAWLRKQRDRSSSKFVLSLKNKKVMTLSAFRSMWKLVERELPETHITAHILRHTYITRLFEAGLDVKEIQYLAGHSTMDMTPSVYTHYDRKNREQQTAEKVRRAFCKEAV